ncbi:GNAT family N-acetyltransferase [Cohnella hongkongensis]|uniref:GNAT family N-acetyltransferase n=1 Tax=Cohnella hongkongensis TaxID=178337 RepID=A0ABV9F683_9BACL
MYEARLITRRESFMALEEDWESLVRHIEDAEIFDFWDWNRIYVKHFLEDDGLFVVALYDGARCVAIAPMRIYCKRFRKFPLLKVRAMQPIDSGYKDYCRFYLHRDYRYSELIERLIDVIVEHRAEWDYIELVNFNSRHRTTRLVQQAFRSRLDTTVERYEETPFVDYRSFSKATVNKQRLSAIDRKERKLLRENQVNVQVGQPFDQRKWEAMVELHRRRWGESSVFSDSRSIAFWNELLYALDRRKQLEFSFLEVEGQLAAAHMGFQTDKKIYYYTPAFDPAYADKGVGLVLLKRMLGHYREQRKEEFDFLRGSESYKFYWTDRSGMNHNIYVLNDGFKKWLLKGYVAIKTGPRRMKEGGGSE